jgi:hypothetical protein
MPTDTISRLQTQIGNAGFVVSVGRIEGCTKIAGTDTWSQHAWGNAIDYVGSPAELERLFQWARLQLGVGTVCYRGRGGCTTAHDDHIHIDMLPRFGGTPPCAKGTYQPSFAYAQIAGAGAMVDAVVKPITSVIDFLQLLLNPQTWLRILWFVGGLALLIMGTVAFAKEFGITPPLPIAKLGKLIA